MDSSDRESLTETPLAEPNVGNSSSVYTAANNSSCRECDDGGLLVNREGTMGVCVMPLRDNRTDAVFIPCVYDVCTNSYGKEPKKKPHGNTARSIPAMFALNHA